MTRYRGGRPAAPVEGRTVIVVEDGLATGATARAAIKALRRRGARRVVLAVPVAPPQTVRALGGAADQVVALATPTAFLAVGQSYEDVTRLLATRWTAPPASDAATTEDDPERACVIKLGPVQLPGDLAVPLHPVGMVLLAHGAASGRHSPRNRLVARTLNQSRLATLLVDLLTPAEESDRAKVLDIGLLAGRLTGTTTWLQTQPETHGLPVGFFGAGIGAGAALLAAADLGDQVRAVVSCGGRPDLAGPRLAEVHAPTLLLVGGRDELVLERNGHAQAQLGGPKALEIIGGAGHLFEEPGALDRVAALAAAWFCCHLPDLDLAQPDPRAPTGRHHRGRGGPAWRP